MIPLYNCTLYTMYKVRNRLKEALKQVVDYVKKVTLRKVTCRDGGVQRLKC